MLNGVARIVRSGMLGLLCLLLLAGPLDCLATTRVTPQAADCCAKGKCLPGKNSDECCQKTIPDGKHFLKTDHPAPDHTFTAFYSEAVSELSAIDLWFASLPIASGHSPPGSPPESRLNLPLLI